MRSTVVLLASACILAGCSHVAAPVPESPAAAARPQIGVTPRNSIVPLVDTHLHMMSPAAVALNARPPSPPAVALPEPLADLLSGRDKDVGETNYDRLFTPDAIILAEEHTRWWSGKARILDAIANFPWLRKFVPTAYAVDDSAGYISGILRSPTGVDSHTFQLGVRKGADGLWRIASEMKQRIAPDTYAPAIDADTVIARLDDAGIRHGVVLSVAYWFDDPEKNVEDRAEKVRAENDWTIAQTQRYPDRLIPFCGLSPLTAYAMAELDRCAAIPAVRGLKLHRNSKFDPGRPQDKEKLKEIFRAANRHRLAILIHLRGDPQLYIDEIFPEAPDVPIVVAHMGASGGDWREAKVFAEAIVAKKPGTANLYIDVAAAFKVEGLWTFGSPMPFMGGTLPAAEKAEVVELMRTIGLDRILFGTDMPLPWFPTPRDWWRRSILTLPFTNDEIRNIADNRPPFIPR